MITVFDSSNYAQQVFLAEAYATIAGRGKLSQEEIDAGKFLSLDGYFAHMEDLVSIEPKFVMIPSDENPFVIDANSRTIIVPASFSKCAGVVGDNMCEIITFTVDRYFDYVDLANANICIQWKLPSVDGEPGEEGISHIGLIDLNTVSGKIRFGWPLTDALTKHAGNITFSVRFYVPKTVEDVDGVEQTQFVYLLNTLSASLPIRAGLTVSGEDVVVEQGVADLFKTFVNNSTNPSFPMPKPVSYTDNLPEQAKVDEVNDTLTLRAQATTAGDGWISYKWYLKEGVSDKSDATAVAVEIVNEHEFFDVNHEDYEIAEYSKNWAKLPKNKQYYIKGAEGDAKAYVRVKYALVDGKHTFTTMDNSKSVVEGSEDLYERWSKLIIVPREKDESGAWITPEGSKAITGLYHVKAINSVGQESIDVSYKATDASGNEVILNYSVPGINSTPALQSVECYVPTPKEVIIESNLDADNFIEPTGAILKVLTEVDPGNPQRTYNWYKYEESDVQELEIEGVRVWKPVEGATATLIAEASGVDKTNFITSEPGWYFAEIISLLNRATKDVESAIARVVDHPVKPEITRLSYAKWNDEDLAAGEVINTTDNPLYIAPASEGDEPFKDEDGINDAGYGNIFQLRVAIKDGLDSKLTTDGVSYKWFMLKPEDKEATPITASMMDKNSEIFEINNVDSNILNVRCKFDADDVKSAIAYYCEITNTLANESVTFGRDDYKDIVMFLVH